MIDFSRSSALLGERICARLGEAEIAIVGVGGVGSWCAEALVRTGAMHVTLVDDDLIAPSNVNRQCPATAKTLGMAKVEAMRARLKEINPACEVVAIRERITAETLSHVLPPDSKYDFIVDAIDSVDCKAELLLGATAAGVPIVSSMGAALRLDPTKVVVRRFDKIDGDGLARALRQRFKRLGRYPAKPFVCACSVEVPQPFATEDARSAKPSYMPVTCAFGLALAAEVVRQLGADGF